MSPQPPTLLDDLWESVPTGPAPVADLVQRGRTRRRRRRLGVAGGALALVVAAGAAISVVPHSDRHAGGVLTPPPGTRYVGIGQVVVAVPEGWADGAATCNAPRKDTVFFPWGQDCVSFSRPDVSSVAITSLPFTETGASRADMKVTTEVDGNPVVETDTICTTSDPGVCRQSFGIPDLHAFFTVTSQSGNTVAAIRNSLRLLPGGQTTVPFVAPLSSLRQWEAALRDAGFAIRVDGSTGIADPDTCPRNAFCVGTEVAATIPVAGSVAPTGSTVIIEMMED